MDRVGVGVVPFHLGRNLLLADEHLGADRPGVGAELAPAADAHVDHRLAGLEAVEQLAQLARHRLRSLAVADRRRRRSARR